MPEGEDFFAAYFDHASNCEVPLIYTRWCAVSGIGALLARQCWIVHGGSKIYPNQYIMLIGNPGARKDTAIAMMRKVLLCAGYDKIAATKTSKERFIMDIAGIPLEGEGLDKRKIDELLGSDDRETVHDIYVMSGEFGTFVGYGNGEFISMLTTLWDNLPDYDGRYKNSRSVLVYQPTVSILGGNTHRGFALTFPSDIMDQGFLSRLLLIYGEPIGRRITFPKVITEEERQVLARWLQEMLFTMQGELELTQEAKQALDDIYQTWVDLDDIRFQHYSSRRLTHLFKLCIICAAARKSRVIDLQDVIYGNTMLTHAENLMPRALGEFGKSKHADVAAKILEFMEQHVLPATINDIWKAVSTELDKLPDLANILYNLEQADKIQRAGKAAFLPKKKPAKADSKYINYSLLKEYKHD